MDGKKWLIASLGFSRHLTKVQCYYRPMHFSRLFQVKYIVKRIVEVRKSGTSCFFVSIPTNAWHCGASLVL